MDTVQADEKPAAAAGGEILKLKVLPAAAWAFVLVVLLYNLGGHYLEDWDEAWYVLMAKSAMDQHNYRFLLYQDGVFWDKTPFPLYPMIAMFRLFGITEATARLSSAIFGIGLFLQLWLLVRRFYGRTASVLALVIGATSSQWLFAHGLRSANIDSITLFFLTLPISSWLLIRSDGWKIMVVMSSLAALFLCKGPIIAIPAAAIAISLILHGSLRQVPFRYVPSGILLFLCIVLPWYIYMYLQFGDLFIQKHIVRNFFHRYVTGIENHGNSGSYYLREVLSAENFAWYGAALVSAAYFVRAYISGRKLHDLMMLVWAASAFFIVNQSQTKLWWYIFPLYPPLIIMTARTLADFIEKNDPLNSAACYAGLFAVMVPRLKTGLFRGDGWTTLVNPAAVICATLLLSAAVGRYLPQYRRERDILLVACLCVLPVADTLKAVRRTDHQFPISSVVERVDSHTGICTFGLGPGDVYYLSKKTAVRYYQGPGNSAAAADCEVIVRTSDLRTHCTGLQNKILTCTVGDKVYTVAPVFIQDDYSMVRVR